MRIHRRWDGLRTRQAVGEAIAWRRQNLLAAGFDATLAAAVANDLRYDVHALLQLVDRGCPPGLAVRILEPLSSEVGR